MKPEDFKEENLNDPEGILPSESIYDGYFEEISNYIPNKRNYIKDNSFDITNVNQNSSPFEFDNFEISPKTNVVQIKNEDENIIIENDNFTNNLNFNQQWGITGIANNTIEFNDLPVTNTNNFSMNQFSISNNTNFINLDNIEDDDEETKNNRKRQAENEQRQKVVREKIENEIKMKNQLRTQAINFIENFNRYI
jgi:hypothetical protein